MSPEANTVSPALLDLVLRVSTGAGSRPEAGNVGLTRMVEYCLFTLVVVSLRNLGCSEIGSEISGFGGREGRRGKDGIS